MRYHRTAEHFVGINKLFRFDTKEYFMKFLATLLILASLVLGLAGCDSKTKKAAEISYQFSGLVLDLAKATDRAYTEGLINLAQKDLAVNIIRKMNAGAKSLNDIVKEFAKDPTVPPDKKALLNRILSQEIIDPFLRLISELGAAAQIDALRPIISAIRIAILTLSTTFSQYVDVATTRRLQDA